jgi:hypothetical protein
MPSKKALSEYNLFVREKRLKGLSMQEIGAEWRAKSQGKVAKPKTTTKLFYDPATMHPAALQIPKRR